MRRYLGIIQVILFHISLLYVLGFSSCAPNKDFDNQVNYNIHTFYYSWYGTPEIDGEYHHWNHSVVPRRGDPRWDSLNPFPGGDDIGANFYPALGCYSSNDPEIIDQHMEMIRKAGIGVVVLSWWGKGSFDDKSVSKYLDIAQKYKLKIAFHIEPFYRTIEDFRDQIAYISDNYGAHPALFLYLEKPLYYVYDSYRISAEEWRKILDPDGDMTIRNTDIDATLVGIWMLKSSGDFFLESGFDGFYTYHVSDAYVYASNPVNWPEMATFALENDLMFIPCAGPGYIDTRIRPWNSRVTKNRDDGAYYQYMFQSAVDVHPKIIGITSFNEWHEGTQIEPAIPKTLQSYSYEDYGKDIDPMFYIHMTRELVDKFK